ncbi:MAG: bifunctional transaldolase/phosoglucose isomerase [Brevefilum sp.]
MSSVIKLKLLGQSIWYDNVSRGLLRDGTIKGMIERREIYGVTSNPSIFEKAIANSHDYDDDLQTMSWAGMDAKEMFYKLAIQDIQDVADLFLPYYDASGGDDGFVSLEVNPNLAHDTSGTIEEVNRLWRQVDRPNLMVKIPATEAGLPAIRDCIAAGVNVNITLIFSRKRYRAVMDAYLTGLEQRLDAGKDISGIASVASFFVSRLETKADDRLQRIIDEGGEKAEIAKALKGKIAVDNTRLAYQDYEEIFESDRFKALADAGAQKQRPLWASTSTKDEAYNDIKYVSELVAENTVNTIPPSTLDAFLDHGDPQIRIYENLDQAEEDFEKLADLGISIDEITQELEDEGVEKFADSFNALIETIEDQRQEYRSGLGNQAEALSSEVQVLKAGDVVERIYRNDPTIWTNSKEGMDEIQKRLGWLDLPGESQMFVSELHEFAQQCQEDGFTKALLLGMGGSSLAPETMSLVLGDQSDGLDLIVLDSTIPAQVRSAEDWVDYGKTLFIVASKSGTTSETLSLFQYFWTKSEHHLGDKRGKYFIAITDPGSNLAEIGESHGFRRVFTANPTVGGRYSALTHFGLVPAALLGIDLVELLDRAQTVARKCSNSRDLELNLGALLGIYIGLSAIAGRDKLTVLTDSDLAPFGAWLEQLIAESSGKDGKGIVPVADEPLVDPDSYGDDRLLVYLRDTGERDGFVEDLQNGGQNVIVLNVPDRYSLAAQFYRWEFAVAVACSLIGVNAFDQPDVQDNKKRTKEKIADYLQEGRLKEPKVLWEEQDVRVFGAAFEGLSACETPSEVINAFIDLSKEGDYIAINAYVPRNKETENKLNHLREQILQKTGRATTLGIGPRFLHSTGQLHKGGANNGVFIQITQEDRSDLDIPGKKYSFGVLARAQAQGDLEALLARGRRAIRIHLPADDPLKFDL